MISYKHVLADTLPTGQMIHPVTNSSLAEGSV